MNSSDSCPETHFRCPGESNHCLPVFVRCNGVYDCAGHEDEAECDNYTCPGVWPLSVVNLSTLTNILVCGLSCLMGLLEVADMDVWIVRFAMYLLPVNPTLSPFLYIFKVLAEKRKTAEMTRLMALTNTRVKFKA
nr:hypothetical protein BaRGS_002711 [Batillaria attramentaria]KAG5694760.1 hypothetical protein BaRGS_002713 [Batillaria attramentaria]